MSAFHQPSCFFVIAADCIFLWLSHSRYSWYQGTLGCSNMPCVLFMPKHIMFNHTMTMVVVFWSSCYFFQFPAWLGGRQYAHNCATDGTFPMQQVCFFLNQLWPWLNCCLANVTAICRAAVPHTTVLTHAQEEDVDHATITNRDPWDD